MIQFSMPAFSTVQTPIWVGAHLLVRYRVFTHIERNVVIPGGDYPDALQRLTHVARKEEAAAAFSPLQAATSVHSSYHDAELGFVGDEPAAVVLHRQADLSQGGEGRGNRRRRMGYIIEPGTLHLPITERPTVFPNQLMPIPNLFGVSRVGDTVAMIYKPSKRERQKQRFKRSKFGLNIADRLLHMLPESVTKQAFGLSPHKTVVMTYKHTSGGLTFMELPHCPAVIAISPDELTIGVICHRLNPDETEANVYFYDL
jgi:hypothetical protein